MADNEGSMGSSNIANQTGTSTSPNIGGTNKKAKVLKDVISKGKTMTGKAPDTIIFNPVMEEKEKTAVMTFGRFNPPTTGHEKLIHKVESVAAEHGGTAHIIASHSEGTGKNPLPTEKKLGYLKKVAKQDTHVSSSSKESPSFLHQAKKLHDAGHKHLVMVAGSDRVDEYHKKLHQYNGTHEGALYNFKSIKVVSAGHRDPDAEGTEGMSGTKMREHARSGDMKGFKSGLPKALHPHAKEIADHIRSVKEDMDIVFDNFIFETAIEEINAVYDKVMRDNLNELVNKKDTHLRDEGTSSLVDIYKNDTPGEKKVDKKFAEAFKATDREAVMRSGQDRKKTDLVPRSGQDRKATNDAFRQQSIVKKIIDESVNSAGGGNVRGMGYNSGNPDGDTPNHISNNIASADTQNDLLKKFKKQFHDNHHKKVQKEELELLEAVKVADRDSKEPFAIATKTRKGTLRRVPDTRFDTYDSAHKYGMQYHTDKYGSQMFHVVHHLDSMKEEYETPVTKKKFGKTEHYQALDDLDLNTTNRNHTIDEYGYGPLNPNDELNSNKFWQDKADLWNTSLEAAKNARCGNCAAFNQTESILKKIYDGLGPEGKTISKLADLGFCEIFEFKCAGTRTCDAWLKGGPITDENEISEDLRDWFKDKWVRFDTKGKIKGDCAREPGEGKPKCLPLAKARAMDKEERAKAARRKRREDPVADRPGKGGAPVNVRTEETLHEISAELVGKVNKARLTKPAKTAEADKTRAIAVKKAWLRAKAGEVKEQYIEEKNTPTKPELWSRAKALARSKFDVYPSAYANGWAAKWYKSKGGGWKSGK